MEYYLQTKRLLQLWGDGENSNLIRHFFSQLQQLRCLFPIPLVNAITIIEKETVEDEFELIFKSITHEKYMRNIRIVDIRNAIVFLIRKEFRRIVNTTPYIDKNETDEQFLSLTKQESVLGMNSRYLETLIETCFYIRAIYIIYTKPESITPGNWMMYHELINKRSLCYSVKLTYFLLRCLIEKSERQTK
jgi:hypothetical protein